MVRGAACLACGELLGKNPMGKEANPMGKTLVAGEALPSTTEGPRPSRGSERDDSSPCSYEPP